MIVVIDRSGRSRGFSALYLVVALAVLGLILLIGLVVAGGQTSDSSLVPIQGPKLTNNPASPSKNSDSLPAGFTAYTNATAGFSFAYPTAWGGLQAVADPADSAVVLKLSTAAISGSSLADALQVQVDKKASVQIPVGAKGVTIRPVDNSASFNWIVVEPGSDKAAVGKAYTPAPTVVYRSGKAVVYAIGGNRDNCTYTTWVFSAQDNIVRLRIPSFCISDKVADADVQASHKADYDAAKNNLLQSITVL